MEHENLFNLIWGIIKAVVWFVFRLALLVPMLILTFFMAAIGSSKYTMSQAMSLCIPPAQPKTEQRNPERTISMMDK